MVRLLVRVRQLHWRPLFIKPVSPGAGIGDQLLKSMDLGTEQIFTWDDVRPGDYQVSTDGMTWIPITVAALPAEQTFDLRPSLPVTGK